jgi:hypothetical protein
MRPVAMPSVAAVSEVAQSRTVTCSAVPRNPAGFSVMEEAKRNQGDNVGEWKPLQTEIITTREKL